MTRTTRPDPSPGSRPALPALIVLAVLIGVVGGISPAFGGASSRTTPTEDALAVATIPNLTLVKSQIVNYHDSGAWDGDIYRALRPAQEYLLENLSTGGRPAIVFDIDDTVLSNYATLKANDFGRVIPELTVAIEQAAFPPIAGAADLYRLAVAHGVAVFFISGRGENLREVTARNLDNAGIGTYAGLILRPVDYSDPSIVPFKSGARRRIAEEGYRILINAGDQESDLPGGWAERTYKLPNPMYFIP